ncbi:SDR family NAD(P)-dependent oxidoreductase [Chloroflexus sp.]|uniref:SDR family NAD(P)-dependent oxidoreductase n=1 Tax=Chloroflexus sp. TaxID=1904827 RepID=UPI002604F05C|nr:SDR family oxidoreductase [uncultured Chloroflexus sp.]
MRAQNKVIVVTGGGSGIGRALVLHLLRKGARVAAVDLNSTALAETAQLAGAGSSRLSTHVVNVADRAAVAALPAQVIAAHGVVDGVINNAGIIQPFVRVKDLDEATIDRVMNVNFYGTVFVTKAFLPTLLTRPEAHIVNISSMGGFLPVPGQTIYGAAKAAVKLFTEGLYAELLETNVRVTVVFPGAVSTNIVSNSGLQTAPMAEGNQARSLKPLSAEQAASIIIDGMERNLYRVLVGKDARMMDRLYRLNPRFAVNLILRQMKSLLARS